MTPKQAYEHRRQQKREQKKMAEDRQARHDRIEAKGDALAELAADSLADFFRGEASIAVTGSLIGASRIFEITFRPKAKP